MSFKVSEDERAGSSSLLLETLVDTLFLYRTSSGMDMPKPMVLPAIAPAEIVEILAPVFVRIQAMAIPKTSFEATSIICDMEVGSISEKP